MGWFIWWRLLSWLHTGIAWCTTLSTRRTITRGPCQRFAELGRIRRQRKLHEGSFRVEGIRFLVMPTSSLAVPCPTAFLGCCTMCA
ncbi:hypothetical protein BC835DRAFT_601547 [Cytidiella melzeri]|nr:hypothetical protein BC835DRAFT_601547 [Cytidiella melzeri]